MAKKRTIPFPIFMCIFVISLEIVPAYKPVEHIIIILCGLGWTVWGIYGLVRTLRTIPTWVKVFCTIIFGGVACMITLIIIVAILFDTDNYCSSINGGGYVCIHPFSGESIPESHLYHVQPNGIFMDYVGIVTPIPFP